MPQSTGQRGGQVLLVVIDFLILDRALVFDQSNLGKAHYGDVTRWTWVYVSSGPGPGQSRYQSSISKGQVGRKQRSRETHPVPKLEAGSASQQEQEGGC